MIRCFSQGLRYFWRKGSAVILAFSVCFGLIAGTVVCCCLGRNCFSWMLGSCGAPLSIVGHCLILLFPFLISAFAVSYKQPGILLLLAFWKGFAFSYVSAALLAASGICAGFLRFFLMFSDILCFPLLYLYWHRHISGEKEFALCEFFLFASLVVLIGSVDICLILPHLQRM